MWLLLSAFACTVTDELGAQCDWGDAISDGSQTWCPQADAPEVCVDLAKKVADFEILCAGATVARDILEAEVAQALACEDALVMLPAVEDCEAELAARPCPADDLLPVECEGVIIGG